MAMYECPNCGSTLSDSDRNCPYCGAKNPNYNGPEPKKTPSRPATPPPAPVQPQPQPAPAPVVVKKSNFSVLLFVILLLLFWPAAIIYLIVKMAV